MQGVISSYDPQTREGVVMRDADQEQFTLALDALDGSIFRILRQGQRVIFELDENGRATRIKIGSEVDMGLPTAEV
jgi:cold shock CspA family protein